MVGCGCSCRRLGGLHERRIGQGLGNAALGALLGAALAAAWLALLAASQPGCWRWAGWRWACWCTPLVLLAWRTASWRSG
jgi:hypothetical protein